MNAAHRILVADKLAEEGLAVFKKAGPDLQVDVKVGLKKEELLAIIGDYAALAVRSSTQVTAEVLERGARLKVVGRAGIGVDNVDVEAATKRGVVVMNTPEGNVTTTAEHAIALLCSLARKIPQATASMRQGKWEKSKFQGRELLGKTLGVIGLGNIGKVVAKLGQGLQMKVLAADPYVTPERARELGVELASLDELLARADFVTLHVPMVEATKNLISRGAIERMKKGAFLINAARGGLVDEEAAAEALKSGKLGGAAFDVFREEPPPANHPLLALDNVIVTPHLGASTDEAQVNVSIAVAEQIIDFLAQGVVKNAVNAPSLPRELTETVGPWVRLGRKLGTLVGQVHAGGVQRVKVSYLGKTSELPTAPITAATLAGLLRTHLGDHANEVNAPFLAKERGIEVREEKISPSKDYVGAIALEVGGEQTTSALGHLVGSVEPRVAAVNGVRLEIVPEGHVIMTRHRDRPGMIGKVGTLLGQHAVNISRLTLSQTMDQRGLAQAVIAVDGPVSAAVLAEIQAIEGIEEARTLDLSR